METKQKEIDDLGPRPGIPNGFYETRCYSS
jgi:hypothetical protein